MDNFVISLKVFGNHPSNTSGKSKKKPGGCF